MVVFSKLRFKDFNPERGFFLGIVMPVGVLNRQSKNVEKSKKIKILEGRTLVRTFRHVKLDVA